jgi:hypothetical protein
MVEESFKVDDPRGEFWLYTGGGRTVSIAVTGMNGCSVYTDGLDVTSGPPMDMDTRMDILGKFMLTMGGPRDGYSLLILELSEEFVPTRAQLQKVDQRLVNDDYQRCEGSIDGLSQRIAWERGDKSRAR